METKRVRRTLALFGLAAIVALSFVSAVEFWPARQTQGPRPSIPLPAIEMADVIPPKAQIVAARGAGLDPNETVAGILIHGEARAYALSKMRLQGNHVVNDYVHGTAVRVVYNSDLEIVRAYLPAADCNPTELISSNPDCQTQPLEAVVSDRPVEQQHQAICSHSDAPQLSWPALDVRLTTWAEWKAKYPGCMVFVGSQSKPFVVDIQRSPTTIHPEYVGAAISGLQDGEQIAAISLNGVARAFVLSSMKDAPKHIVSDIVEGVPVSVTYCDVHDCVRAFVAEEGSETMELTVAGVTKESMLLKVDGHIYEQRSGKPYLSDAPKFPYANLDVCVTTWGQWRASNPDGLVYMGAQLSVEVQETRRHRPATDPMQPDQRNDL